MCKCIVDLPVTAKEHFEKNKTFKKQIKSVSIKEVVWPYVNNVLTMKTNSNFKVELEGQRKQPEVSLMHTYCPFCGIKYD